MTVDQFPMTVATPAATWSRTRLFIRHDGAAYVIDQQGNVVHEALDAMAEANPNDAGGWRIQTPDGEWIATREQSGCGCQAGPSQRTAERLLTEAV